MRRNITNRCGSGHPAFRNPHSAFTLVELLVVIAIIGILASLLLAAVGPALGRGREARVLAEMTQLDTVLEDSKNVVGAYPPNSQTDDGGELDESIVLSTFKRYFNKRFPQHREPDALINGLVGLQADGSSPSSATAGDEILEGGLTAAEALVFWMSGFSEDPKYPISGPGGPSYVDPGDSTAAPTNVDDPVESRDFDFDFEVARLAPRDENNFFNESDGERYVIYPDPRDGNIQRRINFWRFNAAGGTTPYVYFDASRSSNPDATVDPPAAPSATNLVTGSQAAALGNFYSIKQLKAGAAGDSILPLVQFANDGKFQILAAGRDEEWGQTPRINPTPSTASGDNEMPLEGADDDILIDAAGNNLPLVYPDGPWTGDLADTLANFATGKLEDAQQ